MLCPKAKENRENKNRVPLLARKEKFMLHAFLVYNALIFHACNSAMASEERAF